MATYNFTVRATDNTGSFTDKNFAITVNNTQVDRFVAVGQNYIARSKDGVNWFYDILTSAPSFTGITWGNNQWVAYSVNSRTYYTSPDAMNWTAVTSTIDNNIGGNWGFSTIRYRGGRWVGFINQSSNSSIYSREFWSTDLVNWTFKYSVSAASSSANDLTQGGVWDYDYDPQADRSVAVGVFGTSYIFARTGTGNWSQIGTSNPGFNAGAQALGSTAVYSCRIFFQNGLWVAANGQYGVYTSYNALDWFYRDISNVGTNGGSTANMGVVYSNGRLLTMPIAVGGNYAQVSQSLDAGRSWTQRAVYGFNGANYQGNFRQNYATYGGTTVMFNQQTNSFIVTKDDFNTINSYSISNTLGINGFAAVASRNT